MLQIIWIFEMNLHTQLWNSYFADNNGSFTFLIFFKVVQCSGKGLSDIPEGIFSSARYLLLKNNSTIFIQVGLPGEYMSPEGLVLKKNKLSDTPIKYTFEGTQSLMRGWQQS